MAGRAWTWLSEPLPHDFANTVHWRGTTPVDHIATTAGVLDWLTHEPQPIPTVAAPDDAAARQLRRLRDATRAAMMAVADGAAASDADISIINEVARANPVVRQLEPGGHTVVTQAATPEADLLLGFLAAEVIAVLTDPTTRSRIGFCAAPGCGGLFDRDRPNQTWCHPDCGARARAERHQRRLRER